MNFKIGIIGMEKTGKTSLINAVQNKYELKIEYSGILSFNIYSIKFNTSMGQINLNIWDIINNDKPAILGYYDLEHIYIGADAFILNYDISNMSTLNGLGGLIKAINGKIDGRKLITVGCKSDLQDHEINFEQLNTLPLISGHFITSVNQPDTCCNMFESLIKILVNNQDITFNSVE